MEITFFLIKRKKEKRYNNSSDFKINIFPILKPQKSLTKCTRKIEKLYGNKIWFLKYKIPRDVVAKCIL